MTISHIGAQWQYLSKNTFDNNVSYYPKNNRTVAVRKNDIVFMGVHMPTGFKTKDDDDTMWTDLISFVKSSDKNIVICGDFKCIYWM